MSIDHTGGRGTRSASSAAPDLRTENAPLLRVQNLSTQFRQSGSLWGGHARVLRAVNDVSLHLDAGETLGLVGESGCGKSTLGRTILRLIDPCAGSIAFEGRDITRMSHGQLRPLRSRMQIIFQDPYGSLNPRMTVRAALGEALRAHARAASPMSPSQHEEALGSLVSRVGLRKDVLDRYPHEFSGGQRQRIGIARALAVRPRFIVADEPVSALDLSIQAQIINLLMDLQEELGLSYLFIAHDLKVVEHMSQRIAVMYLGRIVELMPRERLATHTLHPYTQALRSAVPQMDPKKRRLRVLLSGDLPSPLAPPPGCSFHPRCPIAQRGLCDTTRPELRELAPGHFVACHLAG